MKAQLIKTQDIKASSPCLIMAGFHTFLLNESLPTKSNLSIKPDMEAVQWAHYTALTMEAVEKTDSLNKISLRQALDILPKDEANQLTLGAQVLNWSLETNFCATCGGSLKPSELELAKACTGCEKNHYPHITPVVIVLVQRGDELLLARGLPPRPHYSCLAGFLEPGETLEECAKREVKEEVGVEIENLRYFDNQVWPFPSNLMFGFVADWKSGDIKIDPSEISDAQWFSKSTPPEVLPPNISIARKMINSVWL